MRINATELLRSRWSAKQKVETMKTIKIVYNGVEYEVAVRFSAGDSIYLVDYVNGAENDYRFAVASVLKKHIIEPSAEAIDLFVLREQRDDLNNYINGILEENAELKGLYEKHVEETDECYRFALAVKDMWGGMTRGLSKITSQINIPKINMPSVKALDSLATALSSTNQYALKASLNLSPALQQFASTMATLKMATEPLFKTANLLASIIGNLNAQIKPIFSSITIPQVSEERKEELRVSYEAWGKFGWTIPPMAEIAVFNESPATLQEANEYMAPYCAKATMVEFFEILYEMPNMSKKEKKDLREAEFNFEHKNYKSCAMLIFSLLDAKLIRMQRKEDINKRTKRRDSGAQAANHVKKRIENEHDINKKFFMLLSYTNLFACIAEFFAQGNDFKEQPKLANRNFIDHGMLHKNVRRRDCVQLFLLYYNFVEFFDTLEKK